MGNKISSSPSPQPTFTWTDLFIFLCAGYIIWKSFFASCSSCHHKEELLHQYLCDKKYMVSEYLNSKKIRCSYLIEQLKKVIANLPANSPDELQLKEELGQLYLCKWSIEDTDQLVLSYTWNQFDIFKDTSSGVYCCPARIVINIPATDYLDKYMLRLLTQESLEKVFWDNGTPAQRSFLEKLLYRLKRAYANMPEDKLCFAVAYVYNKMKRGIHVGELNKMEKNVIKFLETESLRGYDEKETCAICLEDITNDRTVTECHHFFHTECIWPWASSEGKCPVCRAYISSSRFTT